MFEEEKENNPIVSNKYRELDLVAGRSLKISDFMDRMHSINGLHFVSALIQIFLGTSVVALSLVNSIHPVWLATIMTVIGSISTMVGLYFMYCTITRQGAFDSLLHKAIKRVISSQN